MALGLKVAVLLAEISGEVLVASGLVRSSLLDTAAWWYVSGLHLRVPLPKPGTLNHPKP